MHRDIVYENPEGVEVLAYTEKCRIQAMYIPKRLITVQGHPEFNQEIMGEILAARRETGLFDDAMFTDGMGRAAKYHDGVKVSQTFLKFLLEE
jgi:GMP synthase-like glutamine amidotransferase